jgi:dTMP kinase
MSFGRPSVSESRLRGFSYFDGARSRSAASDDAPAVSAGAPLAPRPRLAGYLAGTFSAQLASNALQVTMPLLFLNVTGSAAGAAFAVTVGSAFDAAGTLLGGWLTDRVSAKKVLLATTWVRAAALAALPLLGGLTLPALGAAYLTECFARGVADTARNTLPSELASGDGGLLKKILAKNQTFFEAGSLAGPFIAGLLIAGAGGVAASATAWLAPIAFAATALAYLAIPQVRASKDAEAVAPAAAPGAPAAVLGPWMRWALVGTALMTLYPLKGLLPAVFAAQVLESPASAAWLVAMFGVGGLLGSLAYSRWHGKIGARSWFLAGAAGTAALGLAFLPGAFWPAAVGVLLYAASNVASRLTLNALIQTRAAAGRAGAAMGAARFTANLTGLSVRFLAGLAFTAAVAPAASFWLIGAGVGGAAVAQYFVTRRLAPAAVAAPANAASLWPGHGLPGRLIAVEGLDGSGKSTQMERLKESLEAKGLKVVVTSWNSSDLVSDAVRRAKKAQTLTPETFAHLNAADLQARLHSVIIPALKEGAVVLADRWFFTAMARDRTRGMKADWLRHLYANVPKPDLTLYFRIPVDAAIARVLARSEGRLGLSENFDDDPELARQKAERHGLNYYEAGLDVPLLPEPATPRTPIEHFREFQTRVMAQYDAMAEEFGFSVLDASRGRDEVHGEVSAVAGGMLGPLGAYKPAGEPPERVNVFDKDPAGDASNIRRNYMNEKRGAHFYFRNMLLPMQERFAQLMGMAAMPKVFLHGSPHIDNYAKSRQGAAMVDFDRSRVGPYAWDLTRLLVSLSLRQKKPADGLLDREVIKQLKKGYLRGFRHPGRPFSEVRELKNEEPEEDELTTDAYLKADKKWAHEMRSNRLPVDDKDVVALVRDYKTRRGDGILERYRIEEAGRGQGSMGFRGLFLVVLAPINPESGEDRIFLNIKQTRVDPDTEWYKSGHASEVERMRAAAELYAPGWELRAGGALLDGVEYYVRQMDPQNVKLKKMLNKEQQMDFAYSVGTQLGRAHRLSLRDAEPEQLEAHLEAHFDELVEASLVMRDEIVAAHARYLLRMKREGLTPAAGGSSDE